MSGDLWLPIPGADPYLVSVTGRVARELRPTRNSKGYMKVCLGRGHQVYVHQLVMLATEGPPPPAHNVDHFDFDRTNNHRANLRYLPKSVNDWRWYIHEQDVDPAELARFEAEYAALEAADQVPSWAGEAS